jgi:hypothetical protein
MSGCGVKERGPGSPSAAVPVPAAAEKPAPAKAPEPAAPPRPEAAPAPTAPVPAEARVAALIARLGADDWQTREQAGNELVAIGQPAVAALEAARKSPDAEVARRAGETIERIKGAAEEAQAPEIPGLAAGLKATLAQNHVSPGMTCSAGDPKGKGTVTASMVPGGGVRLTIAPKDGEAKTYTASNLGAFKVLYPKLYEKYFGE